MPVCPVAVVASYLKTSTQTLARAGKAGTVRTIRIGVRVFIHDSEVQRIAVEGFSTKPKPTTPTPGDCP